MALSHLSAYLQTSVTKIRIIRCLEFGYWDFRTVSGKENRFLLKQLELTLTLPWFSRFHLQLCGDFGMNLIFEMAYTL
jgi:hypothetical protein